MKVLLFGNTDWYLYNFRLPLAKKLRDMSFEVVMVSPPGKYGEKIKSEGFRWLPVAMNRRSVNPISEFFVLKELIKLYKNEKPDLVHHFTIKSVVYGSVAARFSGVKNVVNAVAGLGFVFTNESLFAKILRPFVKSILKFSMDTDNSRLILQNPDDQALFVASKLIDPDHIRLIRGSGVNTNRFEPVKNNGGNDVVNVLLATRLLWDKGIREFIDAVRIIKNTHKPVNFLLAGAPDDGNPASVQNEEIIKWVNEGLVESLGHIENIESVLTNVDIVVLPSYREGLPRILLEAASMGLPLVSTDVPGCREIVKNNINGLLVPVKDSKSLAVAIEYLIDNPIERSRMGRAGREMVLNEFDEKIVIDDTIDVYREVLSL